VSPADASDALTSSSRLLSTASVICAAVLSAPPRHALASVFAAPPLNGHWMSDGTIGTLQLHPTSM
jgi:hypothetical protein